MAFTLQGGYAILDIPNEDEFITLQIVSDSFYIDVFPDYESAKNGIKTMTTYRLDTKDVLGALTAMGVTL